MPGVADATARRFTSGAQGMSRVCTARIAARPLRSGGLTVITRSKRPGRVRAGSSTSARLVAAITTTPSVPLKPSNSVRIWFSVCSRSSLPPKERLDARLRPIASISSMNTIEGATLRASSNS